MKSKLLKIAMAALVLSMVTPVTASMGQEINAFYFTPKISYSYQQSDLLGPNQDANGYALGFSVGNDLGYYYDTPVRIEGEYMYRSETDWGQNGGKFKIGGHSFLLNLIYDFNTETNLTPYIVGGLGLARLASDFQGQGLVTSKSDWNLAFNVGGGVAFYLSESASLDFGYRYVDLGTVRGAAGIGVDYNTHELGVGIRFSGF